MTVERVPDYQDHHVLWNVASDVLPDDTPPAFLGPEVLVQLQVVVEHFLSRAATDVLFIYEGKKTQVIA